MCGLDTLQLEGLLLGELEEGRVGKGKVDSS